MGYGSGAFSVNETAVRPVAQKLTAPTLEKKPFRDVIRSDRKLVGTFIATPHPVMAEARSFRDAVGFCPSSLIQRRARPSISARRGSSYSGLQPTRRGVFSVVSSTGSSSR